MAVTYRLPRGEDYEEDLFMFMQTFDSALDFHGFIKLMGEIGHEL